MKRIVMTGLLSLLLGCSKQQQPQAGALCTVDDGEGFYRVAKVLVVDDGGVHIRLYKNKWKERPQSVDTNVLSLGGVNDKEGFGMGHIPLSRQAFAAWKPVVFDRDQVRPDELDGYEMWRQGGGGYFGNK
jgi:hypothetical protein